MGKKLGDKGVRRAFCHRNSVSTFHSHVCGEFSRGILVDGRL